MPFSNTDYLYQNLPGRFRAGDNDLLLKRFLSWFGGSLDAWDATFDAFYASIVPSTASAAWVSFWLLALFGWSWFPWWFTLPDKRRLYGNFARHLARRGTRPGIELWLKDFGITARCFTRTPPWSEFVYGETCFAIPDPLDFIVEVLRVGGAGQEVCVWDEMPYGEGFYAAPRPLFTEREIVDLVRYQQPQAQGVTIIWGLRRSSGPISDDTFWEQISW